MNILACKAKMTHKPLKLRVWGEVLQVLFPTDLYISVEADRRHKDPIKVFEGSRSVLFFVDEES